MKFIQETLIGSLLRIHIDIYFFGQLTLFQSVNIYFCKPFSILFVSVLLYLFLLYLVLFQPVIYTFDFIRNIAFNIIL